LAKRRIDGAVHDQVANLFHIPESGPRSFAACAQTSHFDPTQISNADVAA
jgi:hypothetical protein